MEDDCKCINKIIDYENYYEYCSECGKIFEIHSSIIYDDYFLMKQEGFYRKPSDFSPIKHFRRWIYLILGESPTALIPDKIINKCRENILSFPLSSRCIKLQINSIRKTLKNMKQSNLNKHTTFIWSMATGKPIPTVDGSFSHKSELIFLKVVNALKKLPHKKIYYPYYIFKIWDLILTDKSILSFIHLQSDAVVKKNDKLWEKICKEINIEYKPTV